MLRGPVEPGQYTALAFTEQLAEAGIAGSIGTVGDALDNALMESTIGLYKTECIEDLDLVLHLGEAVLGRDPRRPPLDRGAGHLHGAAAGPADQMVVVDGGAAPVDRLAVPAAEHVDLGVLHQRLQRPVDGREPDRVAARAEQGVQVLRAAEAVVLLQRGQHRAALARGSAGGDLGLVRRAHGRTAVSGSPAGWPCSS